ncbi:hypothetical protein AG0111_0g3786 [Alternaria gaisen]|uniref:Uncharacterized protein n=1 Tax=Alternaria gaisen TaxID=167740 RepID=A0ACB6FUG1_9PLEO|nr:hypothetical protein AG0111_0g3786 [Alternaria gaisen]
MLQSTLKDGGAPALISVRGGKPFKDAPALTWRIFGTEGEIRITSMALISFELGSKLELYRYQEDIVKTIDLQIPDFLDSLPPTAINIGALYEPFAAGGDVVGFKDAVLLHKLIAKMEKSTEDKTYQVFVA